MLLVDSDSEVLGEQSVWEYLKERDGWKKPKQADEDHAHLMVQLMESWFIADAEYLENFYDGGFVRKQIPPNSNIGTIPKAKVERAIDAATRNTKTKGQYDKSKHSFELLAGTDPAKVRAASPVHAERLFQTLETKLG